MRGAAGTGDLGPYMIVINSTAGVTGATDGHLLFADTGLKFVNGTIHFFVNLTVGPCNDGCSGGSNWTNVTIWVNRSATSHTAFSSLNNHTGQTLFNVSIDTTTLTDGNYTMNVSAMTSGRDEYFNSTWNHSGHAADQTPPLIVDNTAPTVAYAMAFSDGAVINPKDRDINISVRPTEAWPTGILFRVANSTTQYVLTRTLFHHDDAGRNANLSLNFTSLVMWGEGNYTYNVTVNDTTQHVGTSTSQSFVIDRTNPVATMTAPSSATTTTLGVAETMTCAQTDANPGNVTMTRSDKSGSQCTSTSSCTATFTSDSYTSPTFTCAAVDKAGHSVTKTFSFTRVDPPTSGSSSGGGGGGSGSSESSTSALGTVAAETSTTTTLNTAEVKEVTFTTTTKVDNAKVSVDTYTTKPASVPSAPEGTVFSYFEINTIGFSNTDLKKSSIKFAVTQQWLSDNKLTPADVVLAVYRDGAWKVLPTKQASGDETSEYFVAETEGFSTFAIVAQQKTATTTTTTTEETTSEESTTNNTTTSKKSLTWLVALLVVVALVVIFFVVKKRNK